MRLCRLQLTMRQMMIAVAVASVLAMFGASHATFHHTYWMSAAHMYEFKEAQALATAGARSRVPTVTVSRDGALYRERASWYAGLRRQCEWIADHPWGLSTPQLRQSW
jgi:hypothetical protein